MNANEKYDLEAFKNIAFNKKKKRPICPNCIWGTWTGLKYKCALPRCRHDLGK